MPIALLVTTVLSSALAGAWVGAAAVTRGRSRRTPAGPTSLDLRVEGWLACEAAVEREAPDALLRVRTSVPASLRLAYARREEALRIERFNSAEWRRPRSRRERLAQALARRIPF